MVEDLNRQATDPEMAERGLKALETLPPPARPPRPVKGAAGEVPLGAVTQPCAIRAEPPPKVSPGFKEFVEKVWRDRAALLGKTQEKAGGYIYGKHYTTLPSSRDLGEADNTYLERLKREVPGLTLDPVASPKEEFYALPGSLQVKRRIYANVQSNRAIDAMKVVARLVKSPGGHVVSGKVAGPLSAGTREDTVVVYAADDVGVDATVHELQSALGPDAFRDGTTALTAQRGRGIGVADDRQLETGMSFGQLRSHQVATALHELLHRNPGAADDEAVRTVAKYFEHIGLDPQHPEREPSIRPPPPQQPEREPSIRPRPSAARQGHVLTDEEIAKVHELLAEDERRRAPPVATTSTASTTSTTRGTPGRLQIKNQDAIAATIGAGALKPGARPPKPPPNV